MWNFSTQTSCCRMNNNERHLASPARTPLLHGASRVPDPARTDARHQKWVLSLPMMVRQLVVRGSRRAPTPPPDGPTGSPESARARGSFLSLLFRGAPPLAALVASFRSWFGAQMALFAQTTMVFGGG